MLRIGIEAHILEDKRTGTTARYLLNILRYINSLPGAENNFRVFIYSKRPIKNFDFLSSPVFESKVLTFLGRSSWIAYFGYKLPLQAKKDNVDVMFFPFNMMAPLTQLRSIMVIHDIDFFRDPKSYSLKYRIVYNLMAKISVNRAEKIISVSKFSRKELVKHLGVEPSKVKVVYQGVEEKFEKMDNIAEIKEVKKKYGINDRYIFSAGLIFTRRHTVEAIKAFGDIVNDFPDVQFLVGGINATEPFVDLEKLSESINNKAGRKAVILAGFIDEQDMVPLYNGCEFSVYISEYEGFGMPVVETLRCERPVLATNMTALKESGGGYQVSVEDPGDISEIAEKMRDILNNPEFYRNKAKGGAEYVKKNFSWDKAVPEILKLLNKTYK
ncbi:MAG: glycosyltransferase family 1 protein [Candidatus Spechtbacterales bacterium]|nr:glycosyltransferase family 1 protein [Candidatus Spechtbacterales bacterium]